MTASPTDDPASAERRIQELTKELSLARGELLEAREQQAATGGILRAISNSPTDLQGIFQEIAATAARLCDAYDAGVLQCAGDQLRLVAHRGHIPYLAHPAGVPVWIGQGTLPLSRGVVIGRAVLDRTILHVPDLQAETEEYPEGSEFARRLGNRTILAVPLIRDRDAIGAIFVRRTEVRPFTDRQIQLVKTFADQAVIAIENTRLFEEVQARNGTLAEANAKLTETLEQRTATSEILRVISSSPTQVYPVFETIIERAVKLCGGVVGGVFRLDRELIHFVAGYGISRQALESFERAYPRPLSRDKLLAPVLLEGRPLNVPDIREQVRDVIGQTEIGHRGTVFVPILRDGTAIGAIAVGRREVGTFPDDQVALLKTFADQAVIAIENARLFEAEQASKRELQARTRELQESLEYQTAASEVLNVISRSPTDAHPVFDAIVESAARLCDAAISVVWLYDGELLHYAASHNFTTEVLEHIRKTYPKRPDRSLAAGRAILDCRINHIPDMLSDPVYAHDLALAGNWRASVAVPMLRDGKPIGAISIGKSEAAPFLERQIQLLTTFADQAVIAIENTRLFEEVQSRTRELAKTVEDLEIASQHKNQFVANMSHELRTPLAAILGYAELMQEGFYEPLGQKSLDVLTRIRSNGKHLLGLINTVLDIAKIESGQFTLNMSEYAIESVIETVRSATESLAQNKNLIFKTEVAKSLPFGLGDEQRLTQVLLNLVGNAIKFTDSGEVRVAAKTVNGRFNVSVTDTGPGIPKEHQARIFEQFHQVDSSNTKAKGGTGLGLAIAKQIVEMHGGRIWVESTLSKGSTFQMELPTRAQFHKKTT